MFAPGTGSLGRVDVCELCESTADPGGIYAGLEAGKIFRCPRETKEQLDYRRRSKMLDGARQRAKAKGLAYNLTLKDVVIPKRCPLLGIKLLTSRSGDGRHRHNSPTLDRIIPDDGYVPGNVWVISHRANSIKNDAKYWEIRKVGLNLQRKMSEMGKAPELKQGRPKKRRRAKAA